MKLLKNKNLGLESTFLPAYLSLKEVLELCEQDFKVANLPEGKFIKPPSATGKWYKMADPCFEEKIQNLNGYFANRNPFTSLLDPQEPSGEKSPYR